MITTSRYASLKTRFLAKRMARETGQPYLARGKKAIGSIVSHARKTGESIIEIVEEKDGEPYRAALVKVDALGKWEWAGERLLKSTDKVDNP